MLTKPIPETMPLRVDAATLVDAPHAELRRLRQSHVLVSLGENTVLALRAEDVFAMTTDPRTKQIEGHDFTSLNEIPDGSASRLLADFFVFGNGEAHRAKRNLFARAFSFHNIRRQQDGIRSVADEIVADLPRGRPFDFVDAMAARLPAEMIADFLGLHRQDARYFAGLVYDVALAIGPTYPHDKHEMIEAAARELFIYISDALTVRRSFPTNDLLSAIVSDWHANPVLSFDSLVHQVIGVVIGGTDTTRAGFAMLMALLLRHPEQWAAVKADPMLIPAAVTEALRYEPPVGSIARVVVEPMEIGGFALPAGTVLRVSLLSALRDPAAYARPDEFDIRRDDHPRLHPIFGNGPHRCIGEMLARIEMQEALAALIAAAPDIRLVEMPRMVGFGGIRQITAMTTEIG